MSIAIVGAGAFGTGMALALAPTNDVVLWGRDAEAMRQMQKTRQTGPRLPDHILPENVTATADINGLSSADIVLLCLPTQKLAPFLATHSSRLLNAKLVACCKGIDLGTGLGPSGVISGALRDAEPAVLTGPSFAADIARGLPTALTLACRDEAVGSDLQQSLSTQALRIYRTTDVIGAELGGALKNVIAIACGAAMGAGLGQSAQAALMTRGFAEMQRIAAHYGAAHKTLMGLSGFGDLVLTCTSTQSRNFRYGVSLGKGDDFAESTTVEGRTTVMALTGLRLDLPICHAVADLVSGKQDVRSAMQALLTRPLKEE